jgi:hypothetical protein
VERRYLEGIFIGLGSAVAEEKRIVVIAAELAELCGELLLKRVLHSVRIETERCRLLLHLLHIMRMTMTYGYDGVAAVKVGIYLPVFIPKRCSRSFYRLDVPKRVNVK